MQTRTIVNNKIHRVLRRKKQARHIRGKYYCTHLLAFNALVFPPFRAVLKSRSYAAMANFWIGVIPPSAMLGRS